MQNPTANPQLLEAIEARKVRATAVDRPSNDAITGGSRGTFVSPLNSLFAPRGIAVIGATEREASVGRAIYENLLRSGATIHPVNPNRSSVLGKPCFHCVTEVPDAVDLAVIVTPAQTVPDILRDCGAVGIPAAILISSGFKESGGEGIALERRVFEQARASRMRILGPNCLGLMVPHRGLNATFAAGLACPGNVAFISQSGALCSAILDWSLQENVGFSGFVSLGSMIDVDWGDLITWFGDDPHTHSIVCYVESVGDARGFLSAAREVALSKPIIVLKVGRTEAAARAAATHTGALTGSDAVLDAAFRRVGVLRVDTLGELFDMAEVLAKQPRPCGPRLGIVTNAGGPGALATDRLVLSGGALASLSATTVRALDAMLPAHWSHGNPIDVLGDATPDVIAAAAQRVLDDPGTDGLLTVVTPQAMTDPTTTAGKLVHLQNQSHKPLLASWMGGDSVAAGKGLLNRAGIPTFDTPDTATRVFALMWQHSENLRLLYETPTATPAFSNPKLRAGANKLVASALHERRPLLTEIESKRLLVAYGIPTVETRAARSEDEAVVAAERLGFPVVVKVLSKSVTHKAQAGGVHLDLRSPNCVRHAWRAIAQEMTQRSVEFEGVTVQPMVRSNGIELLFGSSVDPQFGPIIMVGAGGSLVEAINDTVVGLPPLTATLARRLFERTRIHAALTKMRFATNACFDELDRLLVRFAQLVVDQPWIASIEINPLLFAPDRMLALDARVVLHPGDTPEASLPRTAIRPYPDHYVTTEMTKGGNPVVIRPIRPDDEPAIIHFHQTLSDQTIYQRYFTQLALEQRVAHQRLIRICFADYDREMALVVERRASRHSNPEIVAVGRLSRFHGSDEAEFAVVVSDQWQGQRLGTLLLKRLLEIARLEKIGRIMAVILPSNLLMLRMLRKRGFRVTTPTGSDECIAEILLDSSSK